MLDNVRTPIDAMKATEETETADASASADMSLTPAYDRYKKSISADLIAYLFPKRGVSLSQKEAFAEAHHKLAEYFRPVGLLEEFEISRAANLMWDCGCLSRYKDSLIFAARGANLKALLAGRVDNADEIADAVHRGDKRAIKPAKDILARAGLSDDDIDAQSYITHLTAIERLKRVETSTLRDLNKLFQNLDGRKREREYARLRELNETLHYQHLKKFGCDLTIKVPR